MTRFLIARLVLTVIGIVVWGYGNATSQPRFMYAGMGVLAVTLLMRFVPKRWFDERPR
jgi:uncharacterized membrane protein YccC